MSGPWTIMLRRLAAAAATATAAAAATAGGRAGNVGAARHADARVLVFAQRAPRDLHQLLLRLLALLDRRQLDRIVAAAVLDRRHQRGKVVAERRAQLSFDRRHVLERALVAGAARQAQVDAELALVVVGHQFLADVGIEERGRHHHRARDRQHDRPGAPATTRASPCTCGPSRRRSRGPCSGRDRRPRPPAAATTRTAPASA